MIYRRSNVACCPRVSHADQINCNRSCGRKNRQRRKHTRFDLEENISLYPVYARVRELGRRRLSPGERFAIGDTARDIIQQIDRAPMYETARLHLECNYAKIDTWKRTNRMEPSLSGSVCSGPGAIYSIPAGAICAPVFLNALYLIKCN